MVIRMAARSSCQISRQSVTFGHGNQEVSYGRAGGTRSYLDMEHTDMILLWGSNARETHPVMFLHMLQGIDNGARMVVVDPRRTLSVDAAHDWLPIRVGADIALANAMGHVIIDEGLQDQRFIDHATTGFDDYRCLV